MPVRIILGVLISFGMATYAYAEDDSDDAQPLNDFFQSDSIYYQRKGEWQISTGIDVGRQGDIRSTESGLGLEYGITDTWQVSMEHMPYARYKDKVSGETQSGHGDTALGLRKTWMNVNQSANSIAVAYEREFATNNLDEEDGKDANDVSFTLAHDLKRDKSQQMTLQVGREFGGNEQVTYANLAAYRKLAAKQVLTGEVNWDQNETWVTPGYYWLAGKGLDMGVGVAVAAGGDAEGHKVLARLHYEWD